MIQSMTGFGRGSLSRPFGQLNLTLRVVNSRFLDIKLRGNDFSPELEQKIRQRITDRLRRGTVTVSYEVQQTGGDSSLGLDREKYEAMERVLLDIQKFYGRHLDMGQLISMGDLVKTPTLEEFKDREVLQVLDKAIQEVCRMRRAEGENLAKDLRLLMDSIAGHLEALESGIDRVHREILERHRNRIKSLAGDLSVDEGRLEQELAILADKMDIREELTRCRSHLDQFRSYLESEDPVGKSLNFLVQELVRETNTIAAKAASTRVINRVIEMKGALESLREQIQNIL